MIYQGDTYTFTLSLVRPDTSVVTISAVTHSGGNNVYTYILKSGPSLRLGTKIIITGQAHTVNNGTFVITDLGTGTFTVANASGTSQTDAGVGTVGTSPNVTTSPILQVIRLSDFTAILGSPATMTALDASNQLWKYVWNVSTAQPGEYISIISYAADGNTFNSIPVEKVRVGDTFVTGTVALDSTVAKDATVAKDSTVAKATDVAAVSPDASSTVLAIKAKTDNLPSDPAGMTLLGTTIQDVIDLHDAALGNQTVDKTQNPAVLTLQRSDNSVLAQFSLTDNPSATAKTLI